jgi:hypothetical protein
MYRKDKFVCDTCGKEYNDEKTCLKHEKTHLSKSKYKPIGVAAVSQDYNNEDGYPSRVCVTFPRKILWYKLEV